jgi:hypothetical protein
MEIITDSDYPPVEICTPESFNMDAGDICIDALIVDTEELRAALGNGLWWLGSEQEPHTYDPKYTMERAQVMVERQARIGKLIIMAAWNQGYRAKHIRSEDE